MKITKPMLAGKCSDIRKLSYPVLATPKLDGIRCLTIDGKAVSRKFKSIPNDHIRTTIEAHADTAIQLDGEIMIEGRNFNDLSGDVRRKDGKPDFYYAVFDLVPIVPQVMVATTVGYTPMNDITCSEMPYISRMAYLNSVTLPPFCKKILPVDCVNANELEEYEEECLDDGFEGVMVRSLHSPYKCGRSTENEGYLLKIKRFEDEEATIIGYEPEYENQNVATRDAFGRTERSSHKENLVAKDRLGKLDCESKNWKETFSIGTGFDADTREKLWKQRDQLIGKVVKFKHQPSGAADRPRFPVFLGFREDWDT